jgi:hypothetical protein
MFLGTALSLVAPSAAAEPGDDLVGLWGARAAAPSTRSGMLTIERKGALWQARIARAEVSARSRNGAIRI